MSVSIAHVRLNSSDQAIATIPMIPSNRPSPMPPAVKIRVVKSTRTVEVKKKEAALRVARQGAVHHPLRYIKLRCP